MVRPTTLVLFLMIGLLATSCASLGGRNENQYYNPEHEKYFEGTDGVTARFVNLPHTLYYYGPDDNAGNTFSAGVELQNEGPSDTRGGVYVSGFAPGMFVSPQIPIFRGDLGACGISFGTIGFDQLGGILSCGGGEVAVAEGGYYDIRVNNFGDFFGSLLERSDKAWLQQLANIGIDGTYSDGDWQFTVTKDTTAHLELYQHGRLFIAVMAGLDFIKHSGREFLLAGDTYNYPGGEYAYFTYDFAIENWPPGLDETTQSFLLTTCYQYTTVASPIVCIDPEPYSENRKVCHPQSRSYRSGNGAPVAITSIEQENTPRKVIFHINVENLGRGTVYDAGKLEKCSPYYPGRVTPEDINVIYLGDVRIGTKGLELRGGTGGITCSPEVIRLDPQTGRGTTTCSYPLEFTNIKSAYQSPLYVELWYGYSEAYEEKVRIKRVI